MVLETKGHTSLTTTLTPAEIWIGNELSNLRQKIHKQKIEWLKVKEAKRQQKMISKTCSQALNKSIIQQRYFFSERKHLLNLGSI